MENCKACNHPIAEVYNFCPHCGAKQVRNRLTIWSLLQGLFLKLANLDFSFFRTTKWLLIKPEMVTNRYIDGVRKIISPPMQYALVALSMYGLFQFLFANFLDLILNYNFLGGVLEGWNNYESAEPTTQDKMNEVINWLQSRNQLVLFSMIPCIAWFSFMFYRKKKYNLAEHAVISIYAVSLITVLNVLLGLIFAPVGSEAAAQNYINGTYLITVFGMTWTFKRSLGGSILKPLGILIVSSIATTVLLMLALLPSAI